MAPGYRLDIIDFNPYDDEKLASITIATVDEVDQAYQAAARAQKQWAATNPYVRRGVFEKALRLIEEREAEISEAIVAELGGTRLKAAFELHLAKEFLREAVQLALRPEGRILPSPVDGKENRVYRVPVGVVGVISPFNFPFLLSIKSVAPALALGNAVVLKPHQNTPIVGGALVAKIFEDAGLPGGLLNVVITDIAEIGDAFLEHPVPKDASEQLGPHRRDHEHAGPHGRLRGRVDPRSHRAHRGRCLHLRRRGRPVRRRAGRGRGEPVRDGGAAPGGRPLIKFDEWKARGYLRACSQV
ncbi:NAD/NADP-dependent betaine aldehyde dehydrogenase [Streptomyces violarus]